MARRLLLVWLAAIAVLVPVAPAAAETTVKPGGKLVTITLKVDVFAGKNVRTGPDGTPIDQYFKTQIENTWGAAFGRLPYKCFIFELEFDFKLYDVNDKGRDGSHKLYVGTETRGWKGVGWDGVPKETSRNGSGDGTRSFENDRKGDIPANAPPTVVAHEFGHLFGLGDDRKDGAPKPGRGIDTVMVGGVPGVDLNQTPRIDKNLIDRIGKVLEKHLENEGKKLPKCETWKGKIRGGFQFPGCTPGTLSGGVTVRVVDDAVTTGTLRATASPISCGGQAVGEIPVDANIVGGTKTRDRFELDFSPYRDGLLTAELAIDDGRASGLLVNSVPNVEFAYLGHPSGQEITLECQNCDDEAVG